MTFAEFTTFGERVRERREFLNLTRTQLGKKMGGTTPPAIWNWENNLCKPEYPAFRKLVDALEISSDLLLGREITDFDLRIDCRILEMLDGIVDFSEEQKSLMFEIFQFLKNKPGGEGR